MNRWRIETDEHGCVRIFDGDRAFGYWYLGHGDGEQEDLASIVAIVTAANGEDP